MGIVNKKQTGSKRYLMKNDSLKGQHRINEQIRAKEVRIVGDEVEPKVYPIAQALRLAEEHEADLVEISPNAQPPVCRIIDYSKFLYQLKKRQKEQKAKQVKVNVKEIRFGPQTDDHDYNFKLKHAKGFLEDGDKVKAYVFFKGRSILFKEQGEVLGRLCEGRPDAGSGRKENDNPALSEESGGIEEERGSQACRRCAKGRVG